MNNRLPSNEGAIRSSLTVKKLMPQLTSGRMAEIPMYQTFVPENIQVGLLKFLFFTCDILDCGIVAKMSNIFLLLENKNVKTTFRKL